MTSRTIRFDILMATDCRFPGGNTSSVVEEIEAQYRAGYRTGILHLPSPVLSKPRPFAPKIRRVLEEGKAELVLGVDRIEAGLLLARHPTVFTDPPRDLPKIETEHVILAVNQVASDDRGVLPYYDVPHVNRQVERLLGQKATWAPIGPRVRQSLEEHAGAVSLLPWDWENVIDVTRWHVKRDGFVADRPVIGRHSRGHWTKWPDTKKDILAAYPADPRYSVRVLGGTHAPAQILDRIPRNWVDLPFNSVSPREFLATIDFFVYFHHPGLIEAFGRVVLEALSAGAVVIAPPYLRPLFGDVCLYGTPADVRRYVDHLYGDWNAFAERSRAGVELTQRRFSYDTHVERIVKLIGEPSAPVDQTPGAPGAGPGRGGTSVHAAKQASAQPNTAAAAPRRQGGTLVIDLRRDTGTSALLSSVVSEAGSGREPFAVVVPAWRAGETNSGSDGFAGARGGRSATTRSPRTRRPDPLVETFPWVAVELSAADRRRYLALRMEGLIATHRPGRIVVLDGDGRDADVVQSAVGDTGAELLLVHRDTVIPPLADAGSAPSVSTAEAPTWALPDSWMVSRAAARRAPISGAGKDRLARLRRKAPTSTRMWARRTMSTLRRKRVRVLERVAPASGLMLFEVAEAELSLPVRAPVTHPVSERLPIALAVVTSEDAEAQATLRALVERAQMTTAFRPAVLAPPSWVDEAAGFDVTLETLVPESRWSAVYGGDWAEYVRRRVAETCEVIHPATVAFIDGTVSPAGESGVAGPTSAVLDVLETARTRRRA